MRERLPAARPIDLGAVAAATAVVLAVLAGAAVLYLLLDVVFLFFLGVVVAAALQPWHMALGRWGIPKSVAVLLIYLLLLVAIALVVLIVGPVVVEQFSRFVATLPDDYARGRASLAASTNAPLHQLGLRLPPFASLSQALSGFWPRLYEGTLDVTTSIVSLPALFATVLAIAFYWTLEMPRFERLLVSLLAVERRPQALQVWHDIESRLGGFLRGQGLAMLFIGTVSALGYAQIGLPNVLALGVLAGALEVVPWIGPLLAVVPAMLVALPLGVNTVLLVMGLAVLLQFVENNVLIPRIMSRAVGVSSLVGLLAILAFGTPYGIFGVLLAIPMAAVIQVLIDTYLVSLEPPLAPTDAAGRPWDDLSARVGVLRQQARGRLRTRAGRVNLEPGSEATGVEADDVVDSRIEQAVGRIEEMIAAVKDGEVPLAAQDGADLAEKLEGATGRLEESETSGHAPEELAEAGARFTKAVEEAESLVPPPAR